MADQFYGGGTTTDYDKAFQRSVGTYTDLFEKYQNAINEANQPNPFNKTQSLKVAEDWKQQTQSRLNSIFNQPVNWALYSPNLQSLSKEAQAAGFSVPVQLNEQQIAEQKKYLTDQPNFGNIPPETFSPDYLKTFSTSQTEAPTQQIVSGSYVVKSGDTLSNIARQQGVSLQEVIAANPQITNPNLIRSGDIIKFPTKAGSGAGQNDLRTTVEA